MLPRHIARMGIFCEPAVLRRRSTLIVVVVVLAVLLAARLALPSIVRHYVNNTLQTLHSYQGSVDEIDIHLWRGAYRIVGMRIEKRDSQQPVPFFSTEQLDLAVEWRSLAHGKVVAKANFIRPRLNLVESSDKRQEQLGTEENWVDSLKQLVPMRFNTVQVSDGTVTFRVPGIDVKDSITAEHVQGAITNLTNVERQGEETFADFNIDGRVLNDAPLHVQGSIAPLNEQSTFDINLKLERVQLPKVNPWLRKFIKADAENGEFELYMEAAAEKGHFKGYAKPLMQNVKIARSDEDQDNVLHKVWENIVDAAFKIFENKKEDQVAARIPFSGNLNDPHVSVFQTIVSVMRNAFVGAFSRSLENSISLHDVQKNLKDVGSEDQKPPAERKQSSSQSRAH